MTVKIINEKELIILESLAKYKFLTSKQMVSLGIRKYDKHISTILKKLVNDKLIDRIVFGFQPGFGRIHNINYLTYKGVDFLTSELNMDIDKIKYPKRNSTVQFRDYYHRLNTVDFNINFRLWTLQNDFDVDFFDYDFDKTGNNRSPTERLTAKTKINLNDDNYIIPDGIGKFSTYEDDFLFTFEMHNGKNTKRIYNKLYNYTEALSEGHPTKKYNFFRPSFVVTVFEFESIKKATIERMKDSGQYEYFINFFLFKTLDEVKNDFFYGWDTIDGKKVNFIERMKEMYLRIDIKS